MINIEELKKLDPKEFFKLKSETVEIMENLNRLTEEKKIEGFIDEYRDMDINEFRDCLNQLLHETTMNDIQGNRSSLYSGVLKDIGESFSSIEEFFPILRLVDIDRFTNHLRNPKEVGLVSFPPML